MLNFSTQTLGLVSHSIPPARDGYTLMLEELFSPVPRDRLALAGIFNGPWGGRARVPVPLPRFPRRPVEAIAGAAGLIASRKLWGRALHHVFPNVRRIVATVDPTMGVATSWAHSARAELWLYAIDLHASAFWMAGQTFRPTMDRWRREALQRADRLFAITEKMADWLRTEGATARIDLLPPLTSVPPTAVRPWETKRPRFVFSGWVYSAQGRALSWIERAVNEFAPDAELRLLTLMRPIDVQRTAGIDLRRWTVQQASGDALAAEIAACTCAIVALDPGPRDPEARQSLAVAFPSKLREYFAIGRPVLCVAPPDYAVSDVIAAAGCGVIGHDEASTREAVRMMCQADGAQRAAWGAGAHRYARLHMDNAVVGERFRRDALA